MTQTKFDPQVEQALAHLSEKLRGDIPELAEILDRAVKGTLSEQDAFVEMTRLMQDRPDLAQTLTAAATECMAPLQEHNFHPGAMMEPRKGRGLPKINPLVEAALIERVQFDGDMPELRTGPMPEGAKPAVSVDTDSRNPVAVGQMLKQASSDMAQRVQAHENEQVDVINTLAEAGSVQRLLGGRGLDEVVEGLAGDQETLALIAKHSSMVALTGQGYPDVALMKWGTPETDLPEYRRGEVPVAVKMTAPRGSALLSMSQEERKANAWEFLSTTQGRRSAVATVRGLVHQHLIKKGWTVDVRDTVDKEQEPLVAHEWVIKMTGPGATQASFSLIDTAGRALAHGIAQKLAGEHKGEHLFLEVVPINRLSDREVGWAARLVP